MIRAFNEEDDHEDDDVPVEEPSVTLPLIPAMVVPGPESITAPGRGATEVVATRVERALSRPRGYSRLESNIDANAGARPRGYSRLESQISEGGSSRPRTESSMSLARRRSAELRAKVLGSSAPPADEKKPDEEKKEGTKLIEDEGMGSGIICFISTTIALFGFGRMSFYSFTCSTILTTANRCSVASSTMWIMRMGGLTVRQI